MVTNGVLLNRFKETDEYPNRINVSLHSLNEKMHAYLTGTNMDSLGKVKRNLIKISENNPHTHIRLNTTVVKDINDDFKTIKELLDFSKDIKGSVKFIELYPHGTEGFVPLSDISLFLKDLGFVSSSKTAKQSIYAKGEVQAVLTRILCAEANLSSDPAEYCKNNNNLFITPSGKIQTCMNESNTIDINQEVINRDKQRLTFKITSAVDKMGCNCM